MSLLGDFLYNYDKIQPDIKEIGKYFKSNNYYAILNLEAPLKSSTPIKKWINLYQSERICKLGKDYQFRGNFYDAKKAFLRSIRFNH